MIYKCVASLSFKGTGGKSCFVVLSLSFSLLHIITNGSPDGRAAFRCNNPAGGCREPRGHSHRVFSYWHLVIRLTFNRRCSTDFQLVHDTFPALENGTVSFRQCGFEQHTHTRTQSSPRSAEAAAAAAVCLPVSFNKSEAVCCGLGGPRSSEPGKPSVAELDASPLCRSIVGVIPRSRSASTSHLQPRSQLRLHLRVFTLIKSFSL